VVPFSATNFLLAISPVRFWPCLAVSLLALLPRHLIYVWAGDHLGDIQTPGDLWSPSLIASLTALAVLPWLTHWAVGRRRRGTPSPP